MGFVALQSLKQLLGITGGPLEGTGQANTALAFHAGKLLALHEQDLPYGLRVLCNGVIETLGRETYGLKLDSHFTAHPKVTSAVIIQKFEPRLHIGVHCHGTPRQQGVSLNAEKDKDRIVCILCTAACFCTGLWSLKPFHTLAALG